MALIYQDRYAFQIKLTSFNKKTDETIQQNRHSAKMIKKNNTTTTYIYIKNLTMTIYKLTWLFHLPPYNEDIQFEEDIW